MNREDIIRIARDAGAIPIHERPKELAVVGNENIERFFQAAYAAGAAPERNILAAWMIQFGFATGHGDTMEQLVDALGSEIVDRIEIEIDVAVAAEREACAKVCETLGVHPALNVYGGGPDWYKHGKDCADAIRSRRNA